MSTKVAPKLQYAALPYRRGATGVVEIMLITSRQSGRWIIPKGWPAPGLSPRECAAREAMEEAGLLGRIGERPIGVFHYKKRLADGSEVDCAVETFAFEVVEQLTSWPEQHQRRTQWFALRDATETVQDPELNALILKLPALFA